MTLLRDDLLSGRAIVLTHGGPNGATPRPGRGQSPSGRGRHGTATAGLAELAQRMSTLGARVESWPGDQLIDEDGAEAWARARAPLHAVIHDARDDFGVGGPEALQSSVAGAWLAVRAIANGALIPGQAGGKVVLVAPAPDSGPYAEAARAALENLARTLSIEWARHRITAVTIAPGSDTTAEQLTTLTSFLVSRAGDYISGTWLALGLIRAS